MNDLLNLFCEMGGNIVQSTKIKTKTNLKCHEYVQMQIVR